jgi:D-sedoheptulose 7-phosphate isomerase
VSLKETALQILRDSSELHLELLKNDSLVDSLTQSAIHGADSLRAGGKIVFAGNGGSFADAQHLAAEFIGSMGRTRSSLPAIALGTNSSSLTAISNDFGYEDVFFRELDALTKKEDFVVFLSTTGNSKNLLRASSVLRDRGVKSVAFLGSGGGKLGEVMPSIVIPHDRTERIQECHILIGHIFCGLVEDSLGIFGSAS